MFTFVCLRESRPSQGHRKVILIGQAIKCIYPTICFIFGLGKNIIE